VSLSGQPKSSGGLLSLAVELLGAFAIRLLRRYLKSWSSTLLARLKNPPDSGLDSGGVSGKNLPKTTNDLLNHQSEALPEKIDDREPYQKGIVPLFKNTAKEWIQDKCPQLGAALAYFTVFSLAPLVLVLLAVFGLIFGGSDQARQKITDQLQYFVDPSGIKVIQDIAANASKPHAGIIGTGIGMLSIAGISDARNSSKGTC
jgi:hypothetical protein